MDEFAVIVSPLVTEKAIKQLENENKLHFIVSRGAGKSEIKSAVEKLYSVKVASVNTHTHIGGVKEAIVQLAEEGAAADIAAKLGIV